ncbi:MAG: hypothetical protein E7J35_05825 [Veillonella sp.]|uniref:hypothetical protein n=1 Tax=Veillonella TaxID=29465 RepID=UPI00020F059A|nr:MULTISPECIES: hypothetical protein [Veillonella]EGL77363.1 hypothetical protein HMPREF9323_1338 [Veillonella parvula ACS-068-V-Sch12]MDU7911163.1 hypothetical protein [Veillonella parvula]MDU7928054.1 hypothetical protein [Veillonella sp.]MDU8007980.1 hypothetical protein [Veillonella sp.]
MGAKIKLFLLATFACVSISLYNIASAQDPSSGGVSMAMSSGIAVEVTEPNFIMPSPVHVFPTVQQAAEYVNITPQMPKLLPVGFNIQSVITLEKDILQVVYVYEPGAEPYYNKASGALIIYRSSNLTGDISGDHKIHKVIETESVDGTKVTFKGSKKMVYLASWMKDGQNHSLEFQHPVTRDMVKAIIRNIVEEKSHTK